MSAPLPAALCARLKAFLQDGKSGEIVLHVKDGRILGYRLTEVGRVDTPSTIADSPSTC
jgi:hypothetical protein